MAFHLNFKPEELMLMERESQKLTAICQLAIYEEMLQENFP